MTNMEIPIENNVVVAGIGCSGNLVHLLEGDQPYGFHGIHGRSLPIAMGVKMGRPDLNVVIVAGDGDFLSIGMEHIAPQAARNLDVCAVIMDNAVYGLTKGQSSPTTELGETTSSTPYGKMEASVNPLALYLTLGVSFIASGFSGKPRELADLITQGMEHPGFAVVHVQSPCTTYNNTYEVLKGNPRKGIAADSLGLARRPRCLGLRLCSFGHPLRRLARGSALPEHRPPHADSTSRDDTGEGETHDHPADAGLLRDSLAGQKNSGGR